MPKAQSRKKRRVRKYAIKVKTQQISGRTPNDFEDLLIEMVINSSAKPVNGNDVENLVYNTTPGMAELGYGFGFLIGRALTLKLGDSAPVTAVLDKIGLNQSYYYPLKDKAIITSKPHSSQPSLRLGKNIHIYEAGIISGYLSTTTGMQVSVDEKRCVYNGSQECQFVATPLAPRPEFLGSGIEEISDAIAHNMLDGNYAKNGKEYYRILAYLPLMDSKISDQILKIMMLSGDKAGEIGGMGKIDRMISNISNYFGVKETKMERKGTKRIIRLRYESYNSLQTFVAMPAAIITGFANSTGNKAQVNFEKNEDNSYTMTIELNKRR